MSQVSSISPIHTISSYTRISNNGPHETTTHVKHTKQEGGSVKVSSISYTTYNVRGQEVHPPKPTGSTLDIMI